MNSPAVPDLGPLRSRFAGSVVGPEDPSWDLARLPWNVAIDQRPSVVAQATSAADVVAAVDFARENGLRVAPQATGHGAAPLADLDGALLLRTGLMNDVTVDPTLRRARVGAGALWEPVAQEAGRHGLVALHGSSPTVGVVGYTLGGGISWLARKYGLAANSVVALDVVTAEGEQRRVSGDDDLFWALRGGGHGFGVVTSIEFELYPVTEVYAGTLFWPGAAAPEILHAYREWAQTVPDEMTSIARLLRLPPLPQVPEPLRDVPVVDIGLAYLGDAAEGDELIRPLREALAPMIDTVGVVPTSELLRLHGDPEEPVPAAGHHTVLRELSADAVDALIGVAGADSGSPLVGVELRHLGGALGRPEPGHGALSSIDGEFVLFGVGIAGDPDGAQAVREHLNTVVEAVSPWSDGRTYLNFTEQRADDCGTAFDVESYERLRRVRHAADPDGLFQGSHVIPVPV